MKKCIYLLLFTGLSFSAISQSHPALNNKNYKIFLDFGYLSNLGDYNSDFFNFRLTNGVQVNPDFYVGVGAGFRADQKQDIKQAALFLNIKPSLFENPKLPYGNLGLGYNFNLDDSVFDGGIQFFVGVEKEMTIKNAWKFHYGISYDVMRLDSFQDYLLYKSININFGIGL